MFKALGVGNTNREVISKGGQEQRAKIQLEEQQETISFENKDWREFDHKCKHFC